MRKYSFAATLAVALLLASLASAEDPKLPSHEDYRIGAGDKLEISVWRNEQLSRVVTVRPDGKISFPLVNDVQASGLSPMQLRELLANRVSEYVPNAEVSIVVTEARSNAVSVIGSVAKPGRFELAGPTTVLDALANAGGLTEFASRKKIFVIRADGKRLPFNYSSVLDSDSPGTDNFLLRARDIVVVP